MFPILGILTDQTVATQDFLLEARNHYQSFWVLVMLLLGAMIFTLVRYIQPRIVFHLLQNGFLFYSNEDQQKIGVRINKTIRFLLLVNFVLMTTTSVIWIFFQENNLQESFRWWWVILAPIFYFIIQLLLMFFTGWIASKRSLSFEINYTTVNLISIYGLFTFAVLFLSFFFKGFFDFSLIILAIGFGAFSVNRIFRSVVLAFQHDVSWYYIILYLWTLEILPLFVIYRMIYHENVWELL